MDRDGFGVQASRHDETERDMKSLGFRCFSRVVRSLGGKGLGLARVPGLIRLHDWVYGRLRPSGIVLLDVHGSKMFFDTELDTPLRSLVTVGTYEALETKVFQSLLRPGMVVADIGANIGYYSLISARAVGADGLVFSFEPDPRNYGLLARSIRKNAYTNIVASQIALSDRKGKITLYADALNAGNSSLGRENVQSELRSYEVETETLDDFILREGRGRKIDLVKMDVQGAEGLVLRGAGQVFSNESLIVMMELEPEKLRILGTAPSALLDELLALGFRIRIMDSDRGKIEDTSVGEILTACESAGYVNLLLEKTHRNNL
jgi:FkbM family methyltransferase